jgi:hypothetical protein
MSNLLNLVMLCIVAFAMSLHYPSEALFVEQFVMLVQGFTYIVVLRFVQNESVKLAFSFLSFQLLHIGTAFALGLGYVLITSSMTLG